MLELRYSNEGFVNGTVSMDTWWLSYLYHMNVLGCNIDPVIMHPESIECVWPEKMRSFLINIFHTFTQCLYFSLTTQTWPYDFFSCKFGFRKKLQIKRKTIIYILWGYNIKTSNMSQNYISCWYNIFIFSLIDFMKNIYNI